MGVFHVAKNYAGAAVDGIMSWERSKMFAILKHTIYRNPKKHNIQ